MAESRIAVYGAIAANVAIAVTKFVVAGVTGSSAMLSEGIHSVVDTGNDLLLLVGMARSKRPPSRQHPFGHGKELYFWSLIVAVLIFGAGGGVSFYEGILHVLDPPPAHDPFWNYVVLGVSALFEGASFTVAWREFAKQRGETPPWEAVRDSKDPTNFMVVAEDFAALAGLAIAAIGIFLSHALDMPMLDGVASMLIGVLLAGVAIVLIRESRGLLVGEGVHPETADAIREIALDEPGVREVGPVLSMYVGPDDVLLTLDVRLDPATTAHDASAIVHRIEARIRERFPKIKRIYIEAAGVPAHRGDASAQAVAG